MTVASSATGSFASSRTSEAFPLAAYGRTAAKAIEPATAPSGDPALKAWMAWRVAEPSYASVTASKAISSGSLRTSTRPIVARPTATSTGSASVSGGVGSPGVGLITISSSRTASVPSSRRRASAATSTGSSATSCATMRMSSSS